MATINIDPNGVEIATLPDGTVRRLGLKPADMNVMRVAPQYADAFPKIPESQWPTKGGGLRAYMPFVEDQNGYGSCGGHGSSAALTAAWNYQFGEASKPSFHFSPVYLYGLVNGGRDNGSTPQDLRQALLDNGCCLISTVPEKDIYSRNYPASAATEASRFKVAQAPVITTFEEVATAAVREQATFSGIFCGNNFNPDANGLLPEWDRRQVGGHCIGTFGELEKINSRWGVWFLNSWGTGWGKGGWAWMPRSYFDGGLPAFGAVAIVSCLPDPNDSTPTPTPHS